MAGPRRLSYSEISTAQACWAKHAFAYTGRLTENTTLVPRTLPSVLSEGRAWGAAAAKWHEQGETLLAPFRASEVLRGSLDADEVQALVAGGGFIDPATRIQTETELQGMLDHYMATSTPMYPLTRLEDEIVVPIPSRGRRHASNRYRFHCFIDGWTRDEDGRPWLVEFKLRGRLSTLQLIVASRQIRWYAWALRQATGINPVGVIVDERWHEAPRLPRMVKDRRGGMTVSHAVDQLTTVSAYQKACELLGVQENVNTTVMLGQRRWQQRVHVLFRESELDEAGVRLRVRGETGSRFGLRRVHADPARVADDMPVMPVPGDLRHPEDHLHIEALFTRGVPKRDRVDEENHDLAVHSAA